jgi:hypothetical protein
MLTPEQMSEFDELGIVRLKGAVSTSAVEAMRDRVWKALEHKHRIRRDDPSTWKGKRIAGTHDLPKWESFPEIASPQICAALDDLLGARNWQPPARWGSLLVCFPAAGTWEVPRNVASRLPGV